jgi:hypothetical protein
MSDSYGPKFPAFLGMTLTIPCLLLLRLPDGNGQPKVSQEMLICLLLVLLSTSRPVLRANQGRHCAESRECALY